MSPATPTRRITTIRPAKVMKPACLLTILGALLLGALTVPDGAAGAATHSSVASDTHVVGRYRAATSAATAKKSKARWRADSHLAVGGKLRAAHLDKSAFATFPATHKRVGVRSYRLSVPKRQQVTVTFAYASCHKARCTVKTTHRNLGVAKSSKIKISVPAIARRLGVVGVVVSTAKKTSAGAAKSAAPSTTKKDTTSAAAASAESILAPLDVVGSRSAWKTNLTNAPLAANSAQMVQGLTAQVQKYYAGVAAFNVWQYNPSWYTVSASQPVTTVQFTNCQNKTSVPKGLFGPGGQFVDVPIPANAAPASGRDANLTVYRPSTDQLWNFWHLSRIGRVWRACWGGRIDSVSSSPGYFEGGFGSSASGLASELGAVSIRDARAGVINHAVTLALPSTANWKIFSWPAQRSDGSEADPNAIPEGTRLRLDPHLDVDALPMTPLAKMIATAAQKYGFIVTERSGCVGVIAESGSPIRSLTGVNPWTYIMQGTPSYSIMKNFPWSRLGALPFNYRRP